MISDQQKVGAVFSTALMLDAQQRALVCLNAIATAVKPGMSQQEAGAMALQILQDSGASQQWHPPIVRFGVDTCKIYNDPVDPALRLQQDDVFFIDIGPVYQGHEADVGATYQVGNLPQHQDCVQALQQIFTKVQQCWQQQKISGAALYQVAAAEAERLGYVLNHQIKGHRVSDFPHRLYANAALGDWAQQALPGIWVLEIQIKHPTLNFGGFMEQVLFQPA